MFLLFVLVIFLILLVLFVFFVFILILVLLILLLVLSVLVLLVKPLAQREIVASLVVGRIVAEALLVGVYSIAIELAALADKPYIVVDFRLAQRSCLDTTCSLKLTNGSRVLLLHKQSATKIVESQRIAWVHRQRLAVLRLCLDKVLLAVEPVAAAYILPVGLCHTCQSEHGKQNYK